MPTAFHNSQNPPTLNFPGRSVPWFWLLGLAVLYIAVRLPTLNHPLHWDEAWILNALQSFADGKDIGFNRQLRMHPPLYLILGLALFPLKQDFAFRMQVLSLIINTGVLLLFILLVANIYHRRIAIYSGIAYSLLPGAIFFSTWIKRDSLVILFCVAALWAFFHRKHLLTGIFLALGFLSKEVAVFYAAGLFLMILFLHSKKSKVRIMVEVFLPIILVSCLWYFFFSISIKQHVSLFIGTTDEAEMWFEPWWYYFALLKDDLGWLGLILLGVGLFAFLPAKMSLPHKTDYWKFLQKKRLLPLYILFPAYLILTISKTKAVWMTIVLYPFLALLVGLGWQLIVKFLTNLTAKVANKSISTNTISDFSSVELLPDNLGNHGISVIHEVLYTSISIIPLIFILGIPVQQFDYMQHLLEKSPENAYTIEKSNSLALAIKQYAVDNENILMMPQIIRPGMGAEPDPIIYWNLKPSLNVYHIGIFNLDYNAVKNIIMQKQIHWLLIFPVKGSTQETITYKILKENNYEGFSLPGMTVLLRVDQYWKD